MAEQSTARHYELVEALEYLASWTDDSDWARENVTMLRVALDELARLRADVMVARAAGVKL